MMDAWSVIGVEGCYDLRLPRGRRGPGVGPPLNICGRREKTTGALQGRLEEAEEKTAKVVVREESERNYRKGRRKVGQRFLLVSKGLHKEHESCNKGTALLRWTKKGRERCPSRTHGAHKGKEGATPPTSCDLRRDRREIRRGGLGGGGGKAISIKNTTVMKQKRRRDWSLVTRKGGTSAQGPRLG